MKQHSLAQQFNQYFKVIKADTKKLDNIAYKIRYEVFSKEFGYLKSCPINGERDEFDKYSHTILIQHLATGVYAGCIRLITPPPSKPDAILPFEKYCKNAIDYEKLKYITQEGRLFFGEISRLAVLPSFVRRKRLSRANLNKLSTIKEFSKDEKRLFPFIAISLFLSITTLGSNLGLNYVVVMMEQRLARLLARYGIFFTQVGETVEYHGQRALYYSDKKTFLKHLKPELVDLFNTIKNDLNY